MAGNIYGYQGVHTPLESVTQGRYTLSDYTNMRTELTARLIALENQGGFVPTNVEITGYLHMLPGGSGTGEIETTSSITGATLYINGEAHCGNLVCDNTAVFGGNLTVNGGSILTGNGSGLTNINDITKLPLSGGTLTNSLTITAPGKYIGDGSLLTGIAASDPTKVPLAGGTMTGSLTLTAPAKFIGDGSLLTGVTSTDVTKLPLAGGTMTGAIGMGANAITSTGSISAATFSGNGAALTNVVGTDATKLPLTGGTLTGNLTVAAGSKYFGDGSSLTGCYDNTKLPLSGGTLTGPISMQNGVSWETFLSYDQGAGDNLFPPANNSKLTTIVLQFQNSCTLNLASFQVSGIFADKTRYVRVIKPALGGYNVNIIPPFGYTFYTPAAQGASSYQMAGTSFSNTFTVWETNNRIYLTESV